MPTQLGEAATEELKELVRHRDRLKQDFDDRVRQLHRLVGLGFPEFTRYVHSLDSRLATALLADYPTARTFAAAAPHRLAKLRYDGQHKVGLELARQLVEAAKRSVGLHHGPAYRVQIQDVCQDLDLWRRRLKAREGDIERLPNSSRSAACLTTIDGIGPLSAARIIAAVGDAARCATRAALAAYIGVVPALRRSGKRRPPAPGDARGAPGWAVPSALVDRRRSRVPTRTGLIPAQCPAADGALICPVISTPQPREGEVRPCRRKRSDSVAMRGPASCTGSICSPTP